MVGNVKSESVAKDLTRRPTQGIEAEAGVMEGAIGDDKRRTMTNVINLTGQGRGRAADSTDIGQRTPRSPLQHGYYSTYYCTTTGITWAQGALQGQDQGGG